jgi:A/G-specific adenine glycosylase
MLQQTTVAAVAARYEKFLQRFPDLPSLARAQEESVLAAWSGLGYYARARNLRQAARAIQREHSGRLPKDPDQLRRLPGFGPYMAAAVASLAYGVRVPAAEANVTRVLSRLFALRGVAGSRPHTERVLAVAARLLPRRRPGDLTAALMDLGQTVCTPRQPRCEICPLRGPCEGRRAGDPERYPQRRRRPQLVRVSGAAAVAQRRGRAFLVQRVGSLLYGLWQFPYVEARTPQVAGHKLKELARSLGLRLDPSPPGHARHTIMNRQMAIRVFSATPRRRPAEGARRKTFSTKWFDPSQLDRAAIPTLTRKIARAAGFL